MLYLQLLLGFVLLVGGGEALVRGATALASRLGVSPLLIGLTVVGFGTSTPELVTSLQAAFDGAPGIAVGNVVGSNTANILLILGVTALLCPIAVSRGEFRRDGAALAIATAAAAAVCLSGMLARGPGALLLAGLAGYIVFAFVQGRRAGAEPAAAGIVTQPAEPQALSVPLALLFAGGGIALTILGARFLVSAATELATAWGVSEAVIGLTVVAVGTSLPELVTGVVAALKREADIAFGNVVGSNIYNVGGILGATALVRPIPVPDAIAGFDVWIMVAATAALFAVAVTGWRVTRVEGAALLTAYGAYMVALV